MSSNNKSGCKVIVSIYGAKINISTFLVILGLTTGSLKDVQHVTTKVISVQLLPELCHVLRCPRAICLDYVDKTHLRGIGFLYPCSAMLVQVVCQRAE